MERNPIYLLYLGAVLAVVGIQFWWNRRNR